MANVQEVAEALSVLAVAYPDQGGRLDAKVLEAQMRLYVHLLSDIDPEILRRAVERHIKTSEWFPKISQLRELAKKEQVAAWTEEAIEISNSSHRDNLLESGGENE